ncbi:EAL domain-containing protein [Paenibacillus sp. LHD-117]|uniref:putative bifunctional diguanylate cyclase/phosphodiesterase n=1 Tax=Paenibacillus sp. LHD-117 TaxID=3071412 RepID=UPI0027E05FA2|nr:EAL domain-containing protein [Paenibacillus sp. LHD-117]MDQ6419868.1 EAL domain-containing protein [Paenibacillus sp. LHD-117]
MNSSAVIHLLLQMLDEIEDSIYIMEVDGINFTYFYVNRAATTLSGITMDAFGLTFEDVNSPEMASYLRIKYSKVLLSRKPIRFEDGVKLPNGLISGESILNPILDHAGNVKYIFSVTRDTTIRRDYEEKLLEHAYHDDLTGLYNRRYFFEHVGCPGSILLFDLDYFKNINDTFGHDAGDAVLTEIASRLKQTFGSSCTLVRLGGDEFIVACEPSREGAMTNTEAMIQSAQNLFRSPFLVQEKEMRLTASIGISLRSGEEDIQTLLKQADIALYRAKGEGRNRHHIYRPDFRYEHVENFIHELELSRAIERDELALVYQPIYSCSKKNIIGAEALLRWKHPELGIVSPADFIPIAEKTGLIIPIGYWVIREVCKCWSHCRTSFGTAFSFSINISSVQLNAPGFVGRLKRLLAEEGVPPQAIELEITESTVIHNLQAIQATLNELRAEGFSIALDDFGTGYSSLSMLTQLPIDKLKIDKSFISDMNEALVSAIVQMAQALRLDVVVEGVEDVSQFDRLANMQCWGMQGYYISKPISQSELTVPWDLALGSKA